MLDVQAIVLGDVQVFGLIGGNPERLAVDQVSQEPDGDLLVAGEVAFDLSRKEIVDL